MISGLIEKELRQHKMLLSCVLLLLAAGLTMILENRLVQTVFGSPFGALRLLLLTMLPLAGLMLSHALVVTEFRNRTQLFLEGLPLPRWRMIAIKYALGLLLMLGTAALTLAMAWQRSRGHDALTPRFTVLIGLRCLIYVWFLWSLCFAHGFMGRYRIFFGTLAIIAILTPMVFGSVNLRELGPFGLVGDRFAYERFVFPSTQLWVSAGYAIFWMAVAGTLGLSRDATIAASLAQRMSLQEKFVVIFSIFTLLLGYITHHQRTEKVVPLHLPGAVEAARGQVTGSAAVDHPTGKEEAVLKSIVERLGYEMAEMGEYLGCRSLPAVFVVHRRDLDAGIIEDGKIEKEQGLMVRANLVKVDREELVRWVVREVLLVKSYGRLNLERHAWVLDGFEQWWLGRHQPVSVEVRRAARSAMPEGFSTRDLERWLTVRRDAGPDGARALARVGLETLEVRYGEPACRKFLAAVLGREIQKDVRACWQDLRTPNALRFSQTVGVELSAFVAEWRETMRAAEARR